MSDPTVSDTMMPPAVEPTASRKLYMVLSPRSLAYARCALGSLFSHCDESVHLHLITDSAADGEQLTEALSSLGMPSQHRASVIAEEELSDAEATRFARYPSLRRFRHGHPCWRKVTDPLLLCEPGEELVLLDPDVYFPNRFRFEETPAQGLKLMWQKPNCLLPPEIVRAAFDAKIRLARHVDIGVSHWRAGSDLEWVDWMIEKLGGASLPRMMHVEAIVWAAIAMREGGGYLDPQQWVCWHRSQGKRVRRKLGASGDGILRAEPWARMKCFHAGGEAKWWVPGFVERHPRAPREVGNAMVQMSFIELTRERYEQEQRGKGMLRSLGYYRVFGSRS